MDELIVFPDAVGIVVGEVRSALAVPRPDVRVGGAVPNPRPARFVTVERVGGVRRNLVVDDAMLSIEAWSNRADDAHTILEFVRAITYRMVGKVFDGVTVYRVDDVGGVQHSPDPVSNQERYVMTLQVSVRGQSVDFETAQATIAASAQSGA